MPKRSFLKDNVYENHPLFTYPVISIAVMETDTAIEHIIEKLKNVIFISPIHNVTIIIAVQIIDTIEQ